MIYKFINRDNINTETDYLEVQSEATTAIISMTKEDYENPHLGNGLSIVLNKDDIDDLIISLTNIQREIIEFDKSM